MWRNLVYTLREIALFGRHHRDDETSLVIVPIAIVECTRRLRGRIVRGVPCPTVGTLSASLEARSKSGSWVCWVDGFVGRQGLFHFSLGRFGKPEGLKHGAAQFIRAMHS